MGKSQPQFSKLAIYLSCNPPFLMFRKDSNLYHKSQILVCSPLHYGTIYEQIARFELASQPWQGRTLTIVLYLHLRGSGTLIPVPTGPQFVDCKIPTEDMLLAYTYISGERITGLEPVLFHIGSVMPYQLGEIRICSQDRIRTCTVSADTSHLCSLPH